MLMALALLQATAAARPSARSAHDHCLTVAEQDPAAGKAEAERWRIAGGGFSARQCAALADAARGHWAEAAAGFEEAAHGAEVAHDTTATDLWAQAGNAWLAAGQPAKAREALDTALAAGTLKGTALGEAQLDHARALVAAGDLDDARTDLDLALVNAPDDPLAWLLSATLARRQNDERRAQKDIAEALRRSSDDASVQLEAGNVAAMSGDEAGARVAWGEAARLAPNREQGRAAVAALRQFDAPATASPPTSASTKTPAVR
jgi:tetratricopeptide (TPR) repeat protein